LVSHFIRSHGFDFGHQTGGHRMLKIGNILFIVMLGMPLYSAASSVVEVSIGINVPVYPELVIVPGYPVYYAPQEEANFFFYDGMFWVYQDDNWYQSSWYNGPWWLMDPEDMPVFVLRIPVRYYRQPPAYFRGWQSDEPPHWGEHWGGGWEQRRSGWNRWNHSITPTPAPLPVYQRQYSGNRYPRQVEQQTKLHRQNYRYQPRDPVVRQHYREQTVPKAPTQQQRPEVQNPRQPSPQPELEQRKEQLPKSQNREENQQDKDATRKPKREQEQEQKQQPERGHDRNE
jgi:hypothetical protein